MYGFIHEDDTIQGFADVQSTWDTLGLATGTTGACKYGSGPYASTCRRIVIPSSGCTGPASAPGTYAHITVIDRRFGPRCEPGLPPNENAPTWSYLRGD